MKKSIVLPLFLGLMLAGCARTNTDSNKVSSNDQPDANKPAAADDKAVTPKADSTADSTTQAQLAAAAAATPAPDAGKVATASPPDTTFDSSMAANPMPSVSTMPTPGSTNLDPSVSVVNPTPIVPASTDLASASNNAMPDISARLTEWKLMPDDIKAEVDSGSVVRSKTPGAGEPTGPMDSILVGQITTRLQDNPYTSMLKIEVSSDKGVVTLTGTARTLDQIGKAIALSLDTGGVTQTISQIKLQPSL
jgi:hypothetical protein